MLKEFNGQDAMEKILGFKVKLMYQKQKDLLHGYVSEPKEKIEFHRRNIEKI